MIHIIQIHVGSERIYDHTKIEFPKVFIWKEAETRKWNIKNKMREKW